MPIALIFSGPVILLKGYFEFVIKFKSIFLNACWKKMIVVLFGFVAFLFGFVLDLVLLVLVLPGLGYLVY